MTVTVEEAKYFYDSYIIYAAPVTSLAGCIDAAVAHRERKFFNDDGEGDERANTIQERFRDTVWVMTAEEQALFCEIDDLTRAGQGLTDGIRSGLLYKGLFQNFFFSFLEGERLYFVLPDELSAIFREVTSREDFPAQNQRNIALLQYAYALVALYGVCEIDQLVAVWNHHHKAKITLQQAEDFLNGREWMHSHFYLEEDLIVNEGLFEDSAYDLLDEMGDQPYYVPTKSEIRACAARLEDYTDVILLPGEVEIRALLARHIQDEEALADAQSAVRATCDRLANPEKVREDLLECGAPVEDEVFCAEFDRLYNITRDNTPNWDLRGYTPEQYRAEADGDIPRFRLPRAKQRKGKKRRT